MLRSTKTRSSSGSSSPSASVPPWRAAHRPRMKARARAVELQTAAGAGEANRRRLLAARRRADVELEDRVGRERDAEAQLDGVPARAEAQTDCPAASRCGSRRLVLDTERLELRHGLDPERRVVPQRQDTRQRQRAGPALGSRSPARRAPPRPSPARGGARSRRASSRGRSSPGRGRTGRSSRRRSARRRTCRRARARARSAVGAGRPTARRAGRAGRRAGRAAGTPTPALRHPCRRCRRTSSRAGRATRTGGSPAPRPSRPEPRISDQPSSSRQTYGITEGDDVETFRWPVQHGAVRVGRPARAGLRRRARRRRSGPRSRRARRSRSRRASGRRRRRRSSPTSSRPHPGRPGWGGGRAEAAASGRDPRSTACPQWMSPQRRARGVVLEEGVVATVPVDERVRVVQPARRGGQVVEGPEVAHGAPPSSSPGLRERLGCGPRRPRRADREPAAGGPGARSSASTAPSTTSTRCSTACSAIVAEASAARSDDLRALDERRERVPDWFCSERLVGYVCYVDRFAGTLAGVAERLDYLQELGVGYLHLMPLLEPRPGPNDGGYAVADYRAVDPRLGDMDGLERLATELRGRGMSLCLDLVVNHTAPEHPWAARARGGDETYRGYYLHVPRPNPPGRLRADAPARLPRRRAGELHVGRGARRLGLDDLPRLPVGPRLPESGRLRRDARDDALPREPGSRVPAPRRRAVHVEGARDELREPARGAPAPAGVSRLRRDGRAGDDLQGRGDRRALGADEVPRRRRGAGTADECQIAYNNQLMVVLWSALAERQACARDRLARAARALAARDDVGDVRPGARRHRLGRDGRERRCRRPRRLPPPQLPERLLLRRASTARSRAARSSSRSRRPATRASRAPRPRSPGSSRRSSATTRRCSTPRSVVCCSSTPSRTPTAGFRSSTWATSSRCGTTATYARDAGTGGRQPLAASSGDGLGGGGAPPRGRDARVAGLRRAAAPRRGSGEPAGASTARRRRRPLRRGRASSPTSARAERGDAPARSRERHRRASGSCPVVLCSRGRASRSA